MRSLVIEIKTDQKEFIRGKFYNVELNEFLLNLDISWYLKFVDFSKLSGYPLFSIQSFNRTCIFDSSESFIRSLEIHYNLKLIRSLEDHIKTFVI